MRAVWAVVIAACAVRLAAVLWLSDTVPFSDFLYYHEAGVLQAQDWRFFFQPESVTRHLEFNWWPPGYPMFLGAVYEFFGPDFRAAVFVQVLLGTATVALVLAIGTRALGRRGGLAAAWLVALDPTYVFATNLLASENLFVVWLAAGLYVTGGSCASEHAARALTTQA